MSRHRTLDEEFWRDPKLRPLPMHTRFLLAALITDIADDEGRFEVSPFALLELVFNRLDPVDVEDVEKSIQDLERIGVVRCYGDGQFGFLRSWFKRQIIDSNQRTPSSLPEPPRDDQTPLTSWEQMDKILALYKQQHGKTRAWNTVAARWYMVLSVDERERIDRQLEMTGSIQLVGGGVELATHINTCQELPEVAPEGKGRERKYGNGGERARTRGGGTDAPEPTDGQTAPPGNCSDEQTADVARAVLASPAGRRRNSGEWVQTAAAFCQDYPDVCRPSEVVRRISRDPPKAGDRFPDAYFLRLFAEIGGKAKREDQWRAKVPDGIPNAVAEQLGAAFWLNYDNRDVRCSAILEAKLNEYKRAG